MTSASQAAGRGNPDGRQEADAGEEKRDARRTTRFERMTCLFARLGDFARLSGFDIVFA